ncbi:hypothetical protein BV898_13633 [Hypsibius exemplaris]|uniref:C3H1-type domain-containing protein n=1 Tax=Hypsibius exemplaris TaxID=2072580 RepID=A0A1W0WA33_HYPEX|nr:hypothetical protein BV898_13633 [Hypsibius exemplaris]
MALSSNDSHTPPSSRLSPHAPSFQPRQTLARGLWRSDLGHQNGGGRFQEQQPHRQNGSQHKVRSFSSATAYISRRSSSTEYRLWKTELCKNPAYVATGRCSYNTGGHQCRFAHGEEELQEPIKPNKYKTELCKHFRMGGDYNCLHGARCNFIHPAGADMMNVEANGSSESVLSAAAPAISPPARRRSRNDIFLHTPTRVDTPTTVDHLQSEATIHSAMMDDGEEDDLDTSSISLDSGFVSTSSTPPRRLSVLGERPNSPLNYLPFGPEMFSPAAEVPLWLSPFLSITTAPEDDRGFPTDDDAVLAHMDAGSEAMVDELLRTE